MDEMKAPPGDNPLTQQDSSEIDSKNMDKVGASASRDQLHVEGIGANGSSEHHAGVENLQHEEKKEDSAGRITSEVSSSGKRDEKIVSQPAGESSVSKELDSDIERRKQGRSANVAKRSKSETTLTSYEALEGSLKDPGNSDNTASSGAGKHAAVLNYQDEPKYEKPPSTVLVPSSAEPVSPAMLPIEPRCVPKAIPSTLPSSRSASPAPSVSSSRGKQSSKLRRGKWTVEEEAYVARVIQDFNSGFLDAPAGTTLRTYLSEKLQCDPMRITKKFTGDACIGKRVFHPAVRSPSNAAAIDKAQAELENLEKRWRRRLEVQQRESAKKAAASAAAVAAGRGVLPNGDSTSSVGTGRNDNVVTRTASWLDRAKSALNDPPGGDERLEESEDLQSQMREVQRLIHEGPGIHQTSGGLPEIIDKAEQQARASVTASPTNVEPADKRLRTAEGDAEALVGFLRSVRASAASGESF